MKIILGEIRRLIQLDKTEHKALKTALRVAGGVASHHQNAEVASLAKATASALEALGKALEVKETNDGN